jgi:putative ABC transport system permease protein
VALPVEWDTEFLVLPEGRDANEKMKMNVYGIDYDFIEMLGMKIVQGRSFSRDFSNAKNFIINESAVRQLRWKDPIGKQLTVENQKGTVVGVARDFHFKSIFMKSITPAVLRLEPEGLHYMLVRYSAPDRFAGVMAYIKEQWHALAPDSPFEYTTLNNHFRDAYSGDKTPELTGILGVTAIFLSCLGLFGLSSFSVERKIKEIGIRKVFGASITGIIRMLIKQFVKLVVIANVIAMPIAFYLMNAINRLIYAYPVDIGIDIFIFTFFITLLVAFFAVTSQTLKAASANPVDSLRYE